MPDLDLSKLSLNMAPTLDFISDMQREQDNAMRALEATRRATEQEELRRHNELVSALRDAMEPYTKRLAGSSNATVKQKQRHTSMQKQLSVYRLLNSRSWMLSGKAHRSTVAR